MNRSILGRAAFSAAVALALGFGARQAVAAPQTEVARPYCEDQIHCWSICEQTHGPESGGVCRGNTCYCFY